MIVNRHEPSIFDLFTIVFRHRFKLLFFSCGITACGLFIASILPAKYGSEAKLLVLVGRESVSLDPSVAHGETISIQTSREIEMNTLRDILTSRATISKAAEHLGTDYILEPNPDSGVYDMLTQLPGTIKNSLKNAVKRNGNEDTGHREETYVDTQNFENELAIQTLMSSIHVSTPKKSTVLTVSAQARTPERAQRFAAALVEVYTNQHMLIHSTSGSETFFVDQKEKLEHQLKNKRVQLVSLRSSLGIGSSSAELSRLETERSTLETTKQTLVRELAGTRARCRTLKATIASMEDEVLTERGEGLPNLAKDGMRQQLYQLEIAEQQAAELYKEDHPDLKLIRAQVNAIRDRFQSEKDERTEYRYGRNSSRDTLVLELQQQQAFVAERETELEIVQEQCAAVHSSLLVLASKEPELQQISLDIDFLERNYAAYCDSLEQARIARTLAQQRISNVNIAQQASYVSEPTGPRRALIAIAGFFLAAISIFPLAITFEQLEQHLATSRHSKQLRNKAHHPKPALRQAHPETPKAETPKAETRESLLSKIPR
jgi:polysaccharide biosynthesis protein PslE